MTTQNITSITKNITSIGIELEGGINKLDLEKLKYYIEKNELTKNFSFGSDGSVCVKNKYYPDAEIKFWHNDLNVFLNFLKYVFCECNFEQNNTCGNHVHFKFFDNRRAISIFSFRKTWKKFILEYKKFARSLNDKNLTDKYLARLKNKYCLAKYETNVVIAQLTTFDKDKNRYRAINLNSYNIHNTLEIRILPHFNSYEEAEKAILWLIETVDKIYSMQKSVLFSKKIININNTNYNNIFDNLTIVKQTINDKINIKINIVNK
jgi:hypothetical protein